MRTCPGCGADVGQGPICPTCGRSLAAPVSWGGAVLKVLGCFGLVGIILAIAVPGLRSSMRSSNDRNASASLKTLATAEADFRANDRDGNGVQDFWTADVAGLYCITPTKGRPGPADAIKEIEVSVAGADSDPLNAPGAPYELPIRTFTPSSPKAGYWFWALRGDASELPPVPYRQDTQGKPSAGPFYNLRTFGFVCYPDRRESGKTVFMISEGNTIIQKSSQPFVRPGPNTPPGPVMQRIFMDWPSEATLKMEWNSLNY